MPTPSGKATAMPAMETDAASRMFEALKITPPSRALHIFPVSTWAMSVRKLRPSLPKLPSVKAASSENSSIPIV